MNTVHKFSGDDTFQCLKPFTKRTCTQPHSITMCAECCYNFFSPNFKTRFRFFWHGMWSSCHWEEQIKYLFVNKQLPQSSLISKVLLLLLQLQTHMCKHPKCGIFSKYSRVYPLLIFYDLVQSFILPFAWIVYKKSTKIKRPTC